MRGCGSYCGVSLLREVLQGLLVAYPYLLKRLDTSLVSGVSRERARNLLCEYSVFHDTFLASAKRHDPSGTLRNVLGAVAVVTAKCRLCRSKYFRGFSWHIYVFRKSLGVNPISGIMAVRLMAMFSKCLGFYNMFVVSTKQYDFSNGLYNCRTRSKSQRRCSGVGPTVKMLFACVLCPMAVLFRAKIYSSSVFR